MDSGLFLLAAGFLGGFIAGPLVRGWTAPPGRPGMVELGRVIAAFNQLDQARQVPPVKKMKRLATGKTYRVQSAPDWGRFVSAVNELSLVLGGGPIKAEMTLHDAEVDFKAPKRGI